MLNNNNIKLGKNLLTVYKKLCSKKIGSLKGQIMAYAKFIVSLKYKHNKINNEFPYYGLM